MPPFVQFGLVDVNESKNIILTCLMPLMIGITNNSEIYNANAVSHDPVLRIDFRAVGHRAGETVRVL